MKAIFYVEVFHRKVGKIQRSCISSELHLERSVVCSSCALLGTKYSDSKAIIAEIARLLEVLTSKRPDSSDIDVVCHTSCDDVLWDWNHIISQSPRKNNSQWTRLKNDIEAVSSFEIQGAGILSRSIRDKARLYMNERVESYYANAYNQSIRSSRSGR